MTNVLHKSISFKNKTVTSNHISLDAIVSRSKPELPVVSACSTLSLSPLEVPGRLSGWLHARFPIPRSSTGSSAPTHGIPDTELSTSICRLQLPKQKERVLFPRSLPELHRVPVRRRLRQMCWDSTHTHTQAPITRISEILARLLSLGLSRSEILSLQLTAKCGYQTSLVR